MPEKIAAKAAPTGYERMPEKIAAKAAPTGYEGMPEKIAAKAAPTMLIGIVGAALAAIQLRRSRFGNR